MYRRLAHSTVSVMILSLALADSVHAGLVAHWKFDDGAGTVAADSSGYGHNGALLLDPQWVAGKFGGALEFAGLSGQHVEMEGYDGILGTQNRTAMAWIKTAGYGDWISWGQNTNTQKWIGRVNDNAGNGAVGALRTECSGGYIISTTVLTDDEWHHVASVLESAGAPTISDIRMYVDGVRETISGSQAVGINTVGGRNLWIADGHHNRPLPSLMDDVRLYDHALTEAELLAAMEGSEGYPYAYRPDPKDGAVVEDTWASLSWSAGDFAVSHDVYLGDNLNDVEEATRDSVEFRGNQTATFYVAGFPGFAYPEGLVAGTTYYWRIDEVNDADPNSPWKGTIWSFSIPPKTAYNPNPADGAGIADTTVTLSWTPGFGAKLNTIYFGDDFDTVANATAGVPVGTTSYNPGPLGAEKVYYWRVDEFDGFGTYKGDVWTFTTPGAVGNPQPANGAADVAMATVLSWTPAATAASHQVYLGLDKDAVRSAGTASPDYKGSRTLGTETYDPGLLEADTAYYWRIDGIYNGTPVKGPVWTFMVGAHLLVDDFESYTDDDTAGQAIWQTWIDGFGTTDNGAQVGYLLPPYAEQTIVHSGSQSMPLLYVNQTGKTNSEAAMTLTAPRDWTTAGVSELSLWFRGASANAAEPLYVAVSNTAGSPAVAAHTNANSARVGGWTQWVIPLQTFADQGINLTNVDKIAVGLGARSGMTAPGGTGTMYFDDIRLQSR
ncbi:MAG: hypothetical protein A2Z25_14275 [Planctomycetes bacterium RBG_16_55_9]|nr:MAG: hypothetical protein A2Z25_14275 [Planctomycetes bacterium RBG_16_55_9]